MKKGLLICSLWLTTIALHASSQSPFKKIIQCKSKKCKAQGICSVEVYKHVLSDSKEAQAILVYHKRKPKSKKKKKKQPNFNKMALPGVIIQDSENSFTIKNTTAFPKTSVIQIKDLELGKSAKAEWQFEKKAYKIKCYRSKK